MLALGLAALAGCAPAAGVQVDRDVAIPMRDGVALRADIYRPARGGPFPVLVFRTPYGKHYAAKSDQHSPEGRASAAMPSSCRTCVDGMPRMGSSNPIARRARTVTTRSSGPRRRPGPTAGLARTVFPTRAPCNGSRRWRRPPHLVAMAPAMTFSSPRRFFYMNGVFDSSWLPWIYSTSLRTRVAGSGFPADGRCGARNGPPSRRNTSRGCRCVTCRGCGRKRRTTSNGWRIRPRIRGGTGRSCAAATARCRPRCST